MMGTTAAPAIDTGSRTTPTASRLSRGLVAVAATAFAGIAYAQSSPVTAPGAPANAPPVSVPAPVACTECGVVKSISAIENNARPAGKGAGARAYAGNKVEAKYTVKQYWRLVVTMDDGSTRNFTYKTKPQFREGDRVSMDNPGHHVTRIGN